MIAGTGDAGVRLEQSLGQEWALGFRLVRGARRATKEQDASPPGCHSHRLLGEGD